MKKNIMKCNEIMKKMEKPNNEINMKKYNGNENEKNKEKWKMKKNDNNSKMKWKQYVDIIEKWKIINRQWKMKNRNMKK